MPLNLQWTRCGERRPVEEKRAVGVRALNVNPTFFDKIVSEGGTEHDVAWLLTEGSASAPANDVMMLSPNLWIWRRSNQRNTRDSATASIPAIDHFIRVLQCSRAIRFPVVPLHLAGGDRGLLEALALRPRIETAHHQTQSTTSSPQHAQTWCIG
jgi:hypothetical protein